MSNSKQKNVDLLIAISLLYISLYAILILIKGEFKTDD